MGRVSRDTRDLYDLEELGEAIQREMSRRNLSYRAMEEEVAVLRNTIHRVVHGKRPDVESYLRLKSWLDRSRMIASLPGGFDGTALGS